MDHPISAGSLAMMDHPASRPKADHSVSAWNAGGAWIWLAKASALRLGCIAATLVHFGNALATLSVLHCTTPSAIGLAALHNVPGLALGLAHSSNPASCHRSCHRPLAWYVPRAIPGNPSVTPRWSSFPQLATLHALPFLFSIIFFFDKVRKEGWRDHGIRVWHGEARTR